MTIAYAPLTVSALLVMVRVSARPAAGHRLISRMSATRRISPPPPPPRIFWGEVVNAAAGMVRMAVGLISLRGHKTARPAVCQ